MKQSQVGLHPIENRTRTVYNIIRLPKQINKDSAVEHLHGVSSGSRVLPRFLQSPCLNRSECLWAQLCTALRDGLCNCRCLRLPSSHGALSARKPLADPIRNGVPRVPRRKGGLCWHLLPTGR